MNASNVGLTFIRVYIFSTQREVNRRMDALAHMLTEPLDPKEESVGHVTEECTLGNCRVNLPEDLLEDVSLIIHSPVLKCHPLLWVIQLHA